MPDEVERKFKRMSLGYWAFSLWLGRVSMVFSILGVTSMLFLGFCLYLELYSSRPVWGWLAEIGAFGVISSLALAVWHRHRFRAKASPLPMRLALLSIFLMLIVPFFVPLDGSLGEREKRANCRNQLKQIGLALDAYAKSNNGYFPSGKGVAGMEMLRSQSYISDYKLFICPTTGAASGSDNAPLNDANCSYIYLGAGLSTKDSPDSPILMDKPDNHTKYGNILFVDGHVQGYRSGDWTRNIKLR